MNLSHCHKFEAIEEMHILFSLEVKFLYGLEVCMV